MPQTDGIQGDDASSHSKVSCICILALLLQSPVLALDYLSFQRDGKSLKASGKVVVEAQDGGVLLLDRAGVLWAVTPEEKTAQSQDDQPYSTFNKEELAEQLLRELPDGFRTHDTVHYLICYNTSQAYAQWCGSLFERLHQSFTNYWEKRGFKLTEPSGPLVALVFDDQASYSQYARKELGEATSSIVGYYSLATNRVTMYDLTGADSLNVRGRGTSADQINRILSRPEAERTVATVIHEATHQIAFNGGLQTRYADIPLWLSEGIAIYFETPDLQNSKGWRGIGSVHRGRLTEFRRSLSTRPKDSLTTLLGEDSRFRKSQEAPTAYAESWALVHFLLKRYPQQFQAYMRALSSKKPLLYDTPEERLSEFRRHFGKELAEIDSEFLRYVGTLR
jgi:hypothetical protein